MAVNLRLTPEAEEALRERAASTGRSQQELLRAAVDAMLGRDAAGPPSAASDVDRLVARGRLHPARAAYRRPSQRHRAPAGGRTLDALDRDERL